MSTERTVGRLKIEDGLARFVGQRHQAAVVLELGEAVLVVRHGRGQLVDVQNRGPVHLRYPRHPPLVCLNRSAESDAVAEKHVAGRLHAPLWQGELRVRRVLEPGRPFSSPGTQRWSEVL